MGRAPCPTEEAEQRTVAAYLDTRGDLLWFHPPNESLRSPRQGRRLQLAGMKRGVPDVLIFASYYVGPQHDADIYDGLAIELKRESGGTVTAEQTAWISRLEDCGWRAMICRGAAEAIKLIEQCYGKPGGR